MRIKNTEKYLMLGVLNRLVGYFTGRSLYGKAAVAMIGALTVINSTSVFELFVTEVVKPVFLVNQASANSSSLGPDQLKFALSLLLLAVTVYWVGMAGKERRAKIENSKLIFEKNTLEIGEIGRSRVHAFCGSVTHISGIEIVVTSENTDLNLGSINGTSVSGRIRHLAASWNAMGQLAKDNLEDFIRNWKTRHQRGNFPLGYCVVSSNPYQAASKGIKTIIFAVAIQKNADGTSTIDEAAINRIVDKAVDTAISLGQRTLFIPIFGLGSGNIQQRKALKITTNAVKEKLNSTTGSVDVYLGVYRMDDLIELCMSFG